MKTQTIEVEGLRGCWKAVAYGWPKKNVDYVFDGIGVKLFLGKEAHAMLIVKQIQLRRMVLYLTQHEYSVLLKIPIEQRLFDDPVMFDLLRKIKSAEVKETDIPLTNEEPYLKLNKKDMIDLMAHIKLGGRIHPKIAEFINYDQPDPKLSLSACECSQPAINKVKEFIKENS